MNREQRRTAKRSARRPARRERQVSQLMHSILDVDFKARFAALKTAAEVCCLASDDVTQIVYNAGFLLFITLCALELEQLEIEDQDVIEALAIMGSVIGDLNEHPEITQQQRAELATGMDYLDALVQPLSKEAVAIAWYQVDTAAAHGDIGTQDLDALLSRLSQSSPKTG